MPERKETYPKDKVSEYIYSSYVLKGGRGGGGGDIPVMHQLGIQLCQTRSKQGRYRTGMQGWEGCLGVHHIESILPR